MARRDLRDSALSSLMGGAPPRARKRPAPGPDPEAEPGDTKPKTGASYEADAGPTPHEAVEPTAKPKGRRRRADGAAPDGYVGRSQYKRKKRGVVSKVAVHLSPDVADALRRAGAVGDENGTNMSEIVETLLQRAGYGG